MDQRSSTSVEELLQISKNALSVGDYAVAKDYAQQVKAQFPMNHEARLIIKQVMGMQGAPVEPDSPPRVQNPPRAPLPIMDIPPGQEPQRKSVGWAADQRNPAAPPLRPEDASGRWEMGLQERANRAMGGSGASLGGRGSVPGGETSAHRPGMLPFVPGPDRQPSRPESADVGRLPWMDSPSKSSSDNVVSGASQMVGDGFLIAGATVRAALGQAVDQMRQITPRAALLVTGFLGLFAFGVYASAISVRTLGIHPFAPTVALARPAQPQRSGGARLPAPQLVSQSASTATGQARPAVRGRDPGAAASGATAIQVQTASVGNLSLPPLESATSTDARERTAPEEPSAEAANRTQKLAQEARKLLSAGKPEDAATLIRDQMDKVPAMAKPGIQALLGQALADHGNQLVAGGKLTPAQAAYRGAIEQAPEESSYHLLLGNAYYEEAKALRSQKRQSLEKYRQAALSVEQAVKLAPNDYTAHHRLALIYEALGRNSDARAAWQRVQKFAPAGSSSAQTADKNLKRLSRQG